MFQSTKTKSSSMHRLGVDDWAQLTRVLPVFAIAFIVGMTGCHSDLNSKAPAHSFFGSNSIDFAALNPPEKAIKRELSAEERLDQISGDTPRTFEHLPTQMATNDQPNEIVRAQSPQDDNSFSGDGFSFPAGSPSLFQQQPSTASRIGASSTTSGSVTTANYQTPVRSGADQELGQRSDDNVIQDPNVRQAQFPEFDTPDRPFIPGNRLSSPNVGSPNELNPLVQPFERGGNAAFPLNYADLDIYIAETQTGRFNFGGAYNSDNGIVGQFTIDEKNFDITRWPRSFRELKDGTAWRGAGQHFHLELVPGANLERYLVSFTEPYLMGTDYSLSVSGYFFERNYFDWDEQRLGGRINVGRRLTPDLSITMGVKLESVTIDNPRTGDSTELNNSLGTSNLYQFNAGLVRDTRDSRVNATEGNFMSLTLSQAFGDFSYTRGDFDFRTYKLMYERPDGSGRHTVSFGTKLGFSGSSTPIFENYFAGGFSTLRGFDFRGAAPLENGVRVGGEFQWLNTVEYMFPITADDALKGVVFCDFGTVEESIEFNSENFRVAPGFGFRVAMPGQAGGAPLAFDFAFPIATADGDDEKVFSFYLGVLR